MTRDELLERISIDPEICFGKPCIKGHRIWVSLVLDLLASGWSFQQVLDNYPGIEEGDIRACIAYGAEMSRERTLIFPLGVGNEIETRREPHLSGPWPAGGDSSKRKMVDLILAVLRVETLNGHEQLIYGVSYRHLFADKKNARHDVSGMDPLVCEARNGLAIVSEQDPLLRGSPDQDSGVWRLG